MSSTRCSPAGSPSPTSPYRSSTSPTCGPARATGSSSSMPAGGVTCRSRVLPTSLVGSYAQPDWLIDRAKLAGRFPPRVRAKELWRVEPALLAQAQDDATELAIRAQERAGLDLLTDGEIRRESYSNHFATALEGVDVDNPGTALDRSGHPNPVPRIVGPIHRPHPVQVRDLEFLRAHTDRPVKMTVPGPFTMSQQAQNDHYPDAESAAMDYAAAVNAEIRDLFAAGADVVQIDEPYLQARPDAARAYGLAALNRALDGVDGHDRGAPVLRLRGDHPRAPVGLLVPARAGRLPGRPDLDRDRAVRARPRRAGRPVRQDDHPRRDRPVDAGGRDGRGRRRAGAAGVPVPAGRAAGHRPGLRDEVPPAGGRGGQDARHGRGGRAAACRT